ncbi:MAG: four-carbon acid sugar kinase family protein [Burkholderiales bacterium]|nr:four-carbon acid sugar kinase family protein [Burkholderiales bacterium]
MLLSCIADDLTGATDLCVNLAREGLSVIQVNGVPSAAIDIPAADALVVALKSRTIPAEDAVAQALAAHAWLAARGGTRFYFKYCSTFDSTAQGNIGPVTEALQQALHARVVPATPAYPRNQRTVYRGHLFVGDLLLSDTGMRTHPLTPMTDANLVRLLAAQTRGAVGLVAAETLDAGPDAVRARLAALAAEGKRHAIVDAIRDEHLTTAGLAFSDLPLTTGGAGLGVGLARALRGQAGAGSGVWARPAVPPRMAWLSGSCSDATRRQVAAANANCTGLRLDPMALAADPGLASRIAADAVARSGDVPVLVYATAAPAEVAAAQAALGAARAATVVEDAFRGIAGALAAAGVGAFVVAGGETAGAVVEALGVRALAIGPEIAPGVPWTRALGERPLWLALKSGNFGGDDFFARASATL